MKREEIRIGYVVLHYQAVDETCACIETLKRISSEDDVIIIVDNNSPNGSGAFLYKKFENESKVIVILNSENLGFAKGNNVGFAEAKYKYKCNFIVMINNDTLIEQVDFRDRIVLAYEKYHFAVMGPRILQKDGTVNKGNPTTPIHTSLFRVRVGQMSNYARYLLSMIDLDMLFGKLVDNITPKKENTDKYQEDVQIAGCCFIFSEEYIARFEGLNPKTFMYLEEILLYVRIKKEGLKIIYNPDLEIVHLEDVATLGTFKGKIRKARQFKYKCQMQSFKVLLEEIK